MNATQGAAVISNPLEVWDNGMTSPLEPSRDDLVEHHAAFRARTGASFAIATQWTYQGVTYESSHRPIPIPDMSGLVYATRGWKQWVVLNPDGTENFVVNVPRVSSRSVPEEGDLGEPRHMKGDPLHVMYGEGSDGDRYDCRFFFDLHTGQLVRVQHVGRHW